MSQVASGVVAQVAQLAGSCAGVLFAAFPRDALADGDHTVNRLFELVGHIGQEEAFRLGFRFGLGDALFVLSLPASISM